MAWVPVEKSKIMGGRVLGEHWEHKSQALPNNGEMGKGVKRKKKRLALRTSEVRKRRY